MRTLARAPSFTLIVVATLGLGIGVNTAIFTVVDGALLRPLPYDEPRDLVSVALDLTGREGVARERLRQLDLDRYREEPGLFGAIGGWREWSPVLTGYGAPSVLTAAEVAEGTFARVLRTQPFLGRTFLPEEDRPQAAGVVVVSHAFWTERLGADPGVLGRSLTLDEHPYAIVGVMPRGFAPPFVPAADVWRPAGLEASACGGRCFALSGIARLAPDASLGVARARANVLSARWAIDDPDAHRGIAVVLDPLRDELVGPADRALWILLGAVGFVLLIACADVASLLLARGAARRAELSLRSALGAGRAPLLRQRIVESCLLAASGGVVGVTLAVWGRSALVAIAPVDLPGLSSLRLDLRVLAFTATVTLGAGLVFGLLPALRWSRPPPRERDTRLQDPGPKSGRIRAGLVVAQVALAMVLLVGAGLLARSVVRIGSADLGFEPEDLLAVSLAPLPSRLGDDDAARSEFLRTLVDRLEALPSVLSAATTSALPLSASDDGTDVLIERVAPPAPTDVATAWVRTVTPGYFYTMGQRLVEGRVFQDTDDAAAEAVVIVNEALASHDFDYPRRSPLGRRISIGGTGEPRWRTIVGVAADTRQYGIREGERPAVYVPDAQRPAGTISVVVRGNERPQTLASDVRSVVFSVDAGAAVANAAPMVERLEEASSTERFVARVLTVFGLLALFLATVGVYGVVSYDLARSVRDLAIRLALGAAWHDVRAMVARAVIGPAALGVALGTAGAVAIAWGLRALLYDVRFTDPWTFAGAVGTLVVASALACWLPARRAGAVDPACVLKEE